MVAARIAYGKGRAFLRGALTVSAIFFGFLALFFVKAPKLWGTENSNQNISNDIFTPNVAHADVYGGPTSIGGDSAGGGGDSGGDSGDSCGGGDSCGM